MYLPYNTASVITISPSTSEITAVLNNTFATYNTAHVAIAAGHAIGTVINVVNKVNTAQLVLLPSGDTLLNSVSTPGVWTGITNGKGLYYNGTQPYAIGSVDGDVTAVFRKIAANIWVAGSN
jgi:hypothetical protein